jgi:hypothetical protein
VGEGQPVSHESDLLGGGLIQPMKTSKALFGWTEESMDVFHKPTRVLGKEMEAVFIVDVGKSLQAKSVFLHLEKHRPPPPVEWQAVEVCMTTLYHCRETLKRPGRPIRITTCRPAVGWAGDN